MDFSLNIIIMANKNSVVAALLSIIPGLGQFYNEKNYVKSLLFVLLIQGSNMFVGKGLAILFLLVGIIEAFWTANKMNKNEKPFIAVSASEMAIYFVVAIIVMIVISSLFYVVFGAEYFSAS